MFYSLLWKAGFLEILFHEYGFTFHFDG